MRTQRGSIRDLLMQAAQLRMPGELRPFNVGWKFSRKQHEALLLRYAARMRELADRIEIRVKRP